MAFDTLLDKVTDNNGSLIKELFVDHFAKNLKELLMAEAEKRADEIISRTVRDMEDSLTIYVQNNYHDPFMKVIVELKKK